MNTTPGLFSVPSILLMFATLAAAHDDKTGSSPNDPCRIVVLNNLVSELMDAGKRGLLGRREIAFLNPRQGWCFFALAGNAAATLDGEASPLVAAKGPATVEAMRYLPAGRHRLKLSGQAEKLVIRAIPALVFNCFPARSTIAPFGTPSWQWLQKTVLANCNMIEGYASCAKEMAEWHGQGKQWVVCSEVPGRNDVPLIDAYDYWRKSPGYGHPLMAGLQVDEFLPGISVEAQKNALEGIARLAVDPAFRGRQWIPFVAGLAGWPYSSHWPAPMDPFGKQLIQAVLKADWPFSIEFYLPEQPTEAANLAQLRKHLVGEGRHYEEAVPGCLHRAIFTPMYSSIPSCMANTCPTANFRVHLDMQIEILANEPIYAGLYGIQFYRSPYADPDTLRCSARLLRHYCIEGRKDRCFHDPYELKHLLNPDFEEGAAHWELRPAEAGSISTGKKLGYNALQGRYPRYQPYGRAFLVMKRSLRKPNAFSQEITHLEPGRLHSLKMLTADYQDLKRGTSRSASHAISIGLAGVEPQTGPQEAYSSCPFHSWANEAGFTAAKPLWMNYHWCVFRAKSATARLTVSDWKNPAEAGGPAGQELMFSFLELQPYLGEAE